MTMTADNKIEEAIKDAKRLLDRYDVHCETTPDELVKWFEADTPFEDIGLDEVLESTLTVVHELVEIDEVKRMGLPIAKDTILRNLEKVDDAHLRAATVELSIAQKQQDFDYIEDRIPSIEKWSVDPTVTSKNRKEYRKLLAQAKNALADR